jgi:hypothetical protein
LGQNQFFPFSSLGQHWLSGGMMGRSFTKISGTRHTRLRSVPVAAILFFVDFVTMDTDNPFGGVCNVSPQPFAALLG